MPKYDTLQLLVKNKYLRKSSSILIEPKDTNLITMVNKAINLTVTAANLDGNYVELSSKGQGFDLTQRGFIFNSLSGTNTLSSIFSYTPKCENLSTPQSKIYFMTRDSVCGQINLDSLAINLQTVDTSINYKVSLVNVITPNGDGVNDVFEITELPKDNCTETFSKIEIYNRWGLLMYESNEKKFKWSAETATDGLYYYLLKYNKQTIRNWLQVVR
jgi:gliding motility-associated-like protein